MPPPSPALNPAADLSHAVQFYETDDFLFRSVAEFVGAGLVAGDCVLVVATTAHCAAFRRELIEAGHDVGKARLSGQLAMSHSEEMLPLFMVDGKPDLERFRELMETAFTRGRAANPGARIRVFGEMVDILWREGNVESAIRLEEFCNELGQQHDLQILCTYLASSFRGEASGSGFDRVCKTHSRVSPAESFPAEGVSDKQLREVARLQHRARALESEIARGRELEEALRAALRERSRVEDELRHSRAEIADFLNNAVVGLHRVAADGTILWANQAELEMLGYPEEEYLGHHISKFYVDQDRCEEILTRLVGHEVIKDFEARLRHKDGSIRHVVIDSNVLWKAGKFVHTRCFTRDVTSKKRADDALRRLQEITAGLSEANTPKDVAQVVLSLGVKATGASAANVMRLSADGRALEGIGAIGFQPELEARFERIPVEHPMPLTEAVRTRTPIFVGTEQDFRRWADLVVDAGMRAIAVLPLMVHGRAVGAIRFSYAQPEKFDEEEQAFLVALADQCAQALDRARLFEAESVARQEARDADRRKDEFLAMLGHELRNPLAPILTALQLMHLRGVGSDREQRVIERQVRHLVRLVDDLLDVSRITRGKVQLKKERIEVSVALAKAIEMASPLFEQRSHSLEIDAPRIGLVVDGDPVRLSQILANLLTNSAKYTDAGGHISVKARHENGQIVVSVKDDGTGVSPELLPRIFDLFMQGERTLDRSQGGLGIGLTLARNLVELHGGTISCASDGVGRGSEFVVRLPAAAKVAAQAGRIVQPPSASARTAQSRKILVVDDNRDAAEMLADALRALGHEVAVANDGPEALAMYPTVRPDLALLDIGLPVMDGYELAEKLHGVAGSTPLRLFAVTGYGQDSDKARALAAGFEVHLVKPVDLDKLAGFVAATASP